MNRFDPKLFRVGGGTAEVSTLGTVSRSARRLGTGLGAASGAAQLRDDIAPVGTESRRDRLRERGERGATNELTPRARQETRSFGAASAKAIA